MRFEQLDKHYFGKEYEHDLVGQVVQNDQYLAELKRLQEGAKRRGYKPKQKNSLPFKEAIELTKKFQPWEPVNPKKEFTREFRLAWAEKLGLERPEDLERLKIYTSVGGPLDAHGIDFFISYTRNHGKEKEHIITFDITKNPEKEEVAVSADFLIAGDIPDRSDSNFEEKEYLQLIDDYAQKSFEAWQNKLALQKNREIRLAKAA